MQLIENDEGHFELYEEEDNYYLMCPRQEDSIACGTWCPACRFEKGGIGISEGEYSKAPSITLLCFPNKISFFPVVKVAKEVGVDSLQKGKVRENAEEVGDGIQEEEERNIRTTDPTTGFERAFNFRVGTDKLEEV